MNTVFTNPQLKKDASDFAKAIFNFVIENRYDEFTSRYDMQRDMLNKSFYKNEIENRKKNLLEELKKVDFYENQLFDNSYEREELMEIQKTLYNFQLAIGHLFMQKGKIPRGRGSVTSVNPPLTRKVGNNKLDIKPTGRDYGLLFR